MNVRIDAIREVNPLSAVVILYVTPSLKVSTEADVVALQVYVAILNPKDPPKVTATPEFDRNIPDTLRRLFSVSVDVAEIVILFHVIPAVFNVVLAAIVSVELVVVTMPDT